MTNINKLKFYLLSFTWGLPLTLIGFIVSLVMLCKGHKPHRYGYCFYFEVGKGWGGLEFGIVFLVGKSVSEHTKNHEHGHAIQNCYWGPLMPFVICMPSAIRYWYRELKYHRKGVNPPTSYDSVWFEGQASRWGAELIERLKKK